MKNYPDDSKLFIKKKIQLLVIFLSVVFAMIVISLIIGKINNLTGQEIGVKFYQMMWIFVFIIIIALVVDEVKWQREYQLAKNENGKEQIHKLEILFNKSFFRTCEKNALLEYEIGIEYIKLKDSESARYCAETLSSNPSAKSNQIATLWHLLFTDSIDKKNFKEAISNYEKYLNNIKRVSRDIREALDLDEVVYFVLKKRPDAAQEALDDFKRSVKGREQVFQLDFYQALITDEKNKKRK